MKKLLFFAAAGAVMFSSCTKDDAEVAPALDKNLVTIGASLEFDGTRTHLGDIAEDGSRPVKWSAGDEIGLFTADDTDLNVPFALVSGENTTKGKFSGSDFLFNVPADGIDVYGYYPHVDGASISGTTLSGLQIPATQLYHNHEQGSFNAKSAPSVAVAEDVTDISEVELSLKGVASYLVFPIRGVGNVKSLTLTIGGEMLAGAGNVDLSDDTPVLEGVNESEAITLKLGSNEDVNGINFEGTKKVVFVVPAGIDMRGKEIKLVAEFADGSPSSTQTTTHINFTDATAAYATTAPNRTYNIYANMDYNALMNNEKAEWTFGVDGQWVIDSEEDFVIYAYYTQQAQNPIHEISGGVLAYVDSFADLIPGAPTLEDYNTLKALGYEMDAKAIVVKDLDFSAIGVEAAKAKYTEYHSKLNQYAATLSAEEKAILAVQMNAWEWYVANGGAIKSLGYNAVNGDKEGRVIKGLTVKGNGFTRGADLANLVLDNIAVVADEGAEYAGLVMADNTVDNFDYPSEKVTLDNVIVNGGSVTAGEGTITGGIFGKVNLRSTFDIVGVEALPTVTATNWGQVYGFVSISASEVNEIDLETLTVDNLDHVAIYKVKGVSEKATLKVTSGFESDEDFAGVVEVVEQGSVFVDGVSYWNGLQAQEDADNTTLSAEELAYAISARADITLLNHIDMQDELLGASTVATSIEVTSNKVDGVQQHWTISNVKMESGAAAEGNYYSIFGAAAAISNIIVENASISLTAGDGDPELHVSGLALQGSANNVVVNGLTISVAKKVNDTGDVVSTPTFPYTDTATSDKCAIGGVIGKAAWDAVQNVSVSDITIEGGAYYDTVDGTLTASIGAIVGLSTYNKLGAITNYVGLKVDGATLPSSAQTIKMSKVLANYSENCVYSFTETPIGSIFVTAADYVPNTFVTHSIKATECEFASRLAAGYIFMDTFIDAAKTASVEISAERIDEADYMLDLSNDVNVLPETQGKNYIAFTKK